MRLMFFILLYYVKRRVVSLLFFFTLSTLVGLVGCPSDGGESSIQSIHLDHGPPQPRPSTEYGCGNVVCSKPTSLADRWVPWVSCASSIFLFAFPAMRRIWKMSPAHLGVRHTFFCWSLILGVAQCILWTFYFYQCESGHSIYPMWLSSFAGIFIHIMLMMMVIVKVTSTTGLCRIWTMRYLAVAMIIFGGSLQSYVAVIGWVGLGFGFLSHCFRMTSTDYSVFDFELFCYSLLGTASGFIWLYHPNVCVATQFKSASYILGGLRGLEVYKWIQPKIAACLIKFEGPDELMEHGVRRRDNDPWRLWRR